MDRLDQLRAQHASKSVEKILSNLKGREEDAQTREENKKSDGGGLAPDQASSKGKDRKSNPLKKLTSAASSIPIHIRACGLIQWVAFLCAKNHEPSKWVAQALFSWLVESPVTKTICLAGADGRGKIIETLNKVEPFLARDHREIIILEEECFAYLVWLKRLLEGASLEQSAKEEQYEQSN